MIQHRKTQEKKQGVDAALSAVNEDVRVALGESHSALLKLGIPHVLIGGLAVGAHGYAYATKDVDYLVPESSAFDGKLVITFKPGVPIRVGDVGIDYLVPTEEPEIVQKAMMECLEEAEQNPDNVAVVPLYLLAYMKLKAGRAKDVAAIVELLKVGIDPAPVEAFLIQTNQGLIWDRWQRCRQQADAEE